jgi:hypothetical protein
LVGVLPRRISGKTLRSAHALLRPFAAGRTTDAPVRWGDTARVLERRVPSSLLAAVQHIMATHHRFECWTLREASGTNWERRIGARGVQNRVADLEELVDAAFEKSWRFVSTDPMLADGDIEELRTRLSRRLSRLAQRGERDVCRLANGAIFELRRELTAA